MGVLQFLFYHSIVLYIRKLQKYLKYLFKFLIEVIIVSDDKLQIKPYFYVDRQDHIHPGCALAWLNINLVLGY